MAKTILQQNMELLKAQFPDFYETMTSDSYVKQELQVEDLNQNGNLLLRTDDVQCDLHSDYNIDREMERLFAPVQEGEVPVIVIFGLGFGHCLDYIEKHKIKYQRLIIFEPCNNILKEVLKHRRVQELLWKKDLYLHLFTLPNDMSAILIQETMQSQKIKILYHLSYRAVFAEVYDNVLRTFRNTKNNMDSSVNTIKYFNNQWNMHQLKAINLQKGNVAALEGRFKGIPAIIASAGPSLAKHYDLLRKVGDRAVILTPGTSAKIFNTQKIDAHIAMAIDSQEAVTAMYQDYTLNTVLVASHRVHPDVYKMFPNTILQTVLSTEYLAAYYYQWSKTKTFMIDDHPSVSVSAVDLLYAMGCDPIILIGQDLCYYDDEVYASSTDKLAAKLPVYSNNIQDVDIYGEKVYTYRGFKVMQSDLENVNLHYRGKLKIYNATEGGLNIHGIENVKFADMFEQYIQPRAADVAGIIRQVIAKPDKESTSFAIIQDGESFAQKGQSKSAPEYYQHLLTECDALESILREKEQSLDRVDKLIARGVSSNRLDNEMNSVNAVNKKLNENKFFAQALFPTVNGQLTYYRASARYISDSESDHKGKVYFERILDESALSFINNLKVMLIAVITEGSIQNITMANP